MNPAKAKKAAARRRPRRAPVSRAEKVLCVFLLVLIPAAAGAVYRKGQVYDPGLYALDPALVKATQRRDIPRAAPSADPGEETVGAFASPNPGVPAAPALPGAGVPGMPAGGQGPGLPPLLPLPPGTALPPGSPAGAPAAQVPSLGVFPASFGEPGWTPNGRVERFNPDNLYEKIDGKAEFYLKFGAASLQTLSYADQRTPGRFLDAFVYDMGDARNAFGIFANERPKSAQTASLGDQGYTADGSTFFTRGKYYVQVVASERGTAVQQASLKLGRALDAALGGAPAATPPAAAAARPTPAAAPKPHPAPAGAVANPTAKPSAAPPPARSQSAPDFASPAVMLSLFPAEGAVENSSEYLKQDAFGQEFLTDVYATRYHRDGKEYVLFLAKRPDAAGAKEWFGRYVGFLEQLGKLLQRHTEGGMEFGVGEVGGSFDVIFQVGPFFGGANGAPDRQVAQELCVRLIRSIGARAPGVAPPTAATMEHWPTPAPAGEMDDEG
ncbi:MAG: hypothetical protein QHJ73_00730 [Armatimonadota bacterium]|nr:hypothetical protein [Armatimonadota bacterium]